MSLNNWTDAEFEARAQEMARDNGESIEETRIDLARCIAAGERWAFSITDQLADD